MKRLYILLLAVLIPSMVWAAAKIFTVTPVLPIASTDTSIYVPTEQATLVVDPANNAGAYSAYLYNASGFQGTASPTAAPTLEILTITAKVRNRLSVTRGSSPVSANVQYVWKLYANVVGTNTPTLTPTPSNTPTNSPTNSPTDTPTVTPTNSPTNTPNSGCVSGSDATPVTVTQAFTSGDNIAAWFTSPCTQCLGPLYTTQLGVTAFSITAGVSTVGVWNGCWSIRHPFASYRLEQHENYYVLIDTSNGRPRKVYTDLANVTETVEKEI